MGEVQQKVSRLELPVLRAQAYLIGTRGPLKRAVWVAAGGLQWYRATWLAGRSFERCACAFFCLRLPCKGLSQFAVCFRTGSTSWCGGARTSTAG